MEIVNKIKSIHASWETKQKKPQAYQGSLKQRISVLIFKHVIQSGRKIASDLSTWMMKTDREEPTGWNHLAVMALRNIDIGPKSFLSWGFSCFVSHKLPRSVNSGWIVHQAKAWLKSAYLAHPLRVSFEQLIRFPEMVEKMRRKLNFGRPRAHQLVWLATGIRRCQEQFAQKWWHQEMWEIWYHGKCHSLPEQSDSGSPILALAHY